MNEVVSLVELNKEGFIPGPHETLEEFQKRVDFCKSLKKRILEESSPFGFTGEEEEKILSEGLSLTKKLFDMEPSFVPLFFSDEKLFPWHGGAAWIFQLTEGGPLGAILQLRKAFHKKRNYLGLYPRDELIAHELAHVGRMAFEEKKYEEIFAYQTSTSHLMKKMGALLQSAKESYTFAFLLLALLMLDFYALFFLDLSVYLPLQLFKLVPLLFLLYSFFRLEARQKTLANAERKLEAIGGENAPFILYRLTDREIEQFSKMSKEEILQYLQEEPSLRIQVIKEAYLQ